MTLFAVRLAFDALMGIRALVQVDANTSEASVELFISPKAVDRRCSGLLWTSQMLEKLSTLDLSLSTPSLGLDCPCCCEPSVTSGSRELGSFPAVVNARATAAHLANPGFFLDASSSFRHAMRHCLAS